LTKKNAAEPFWYAARWENIRGEKDPWSEILSIVIP
jgi:hypothetical protein